MSGVEQYDLYVSGTGGYACYRIPALRARVAGRRCGGVSRFAADGRRAHRRAYRLPRFAETVTFPVMIAVSTPAKTSLRSLLLALLELAEREGSEV